MFGQYRHLRRYNLTVLIFVVMVSATLLTAYFFQRSEDEKHRIQHAINLKETASIVKEVATSIHNPMASLSANLSANHAFNTENTTEQFHRFIKSKNLLNEYPNVIAWVFSPKISTKNLSETLAKYDREPGRAAYGYAPIKVFPADIDPNYLAPVVIAEPLGVRQQALGYNILSSKLRRDAARLALISGKIQISEPLELKVDAPGVISFQPVYSSETTPQTYQERLEKHIGFVLTAYTTESLFGSVSHRFEKLGLHVDIHDYGVVDAKKRPELGFSTLLSSTRCATDEPGEDGRYPLLELSDPTTDHIDIQIAGRLWRVVVQEHVATIRQHDFFTLIIIASGILLSLLAAALVFQQQNAARLLSERVDHRTKALQKARVELQASRDQAEAQALTDPLTGLGNRRFLVTEFAQIKTGAVRNNLTVAVILFDIDFFKSINDSRGHDFGDKILTDFADLMSKRLADNVCAARLGGDEFAFLTVSPKGKCNAVKTAAMLLKAIREVGQVNDLPSLSGSAGLAKMMSNDSDLSDVMKHADMALYEAKQNGRNCFFKYTKALGERETRKTAVLSAVAEGLQKDAFIPVFHPFVDLQNNKIKGFEILARWQHETRGLLTPAAFWEALEDDAFATRISKMVMEKALKQIGRLAARGFDVGRLGINATEQMLKDRDFADNLIALAKKCNLGSHNLKIEVTERILLSRETRDIMETLEHLAQHGVSIAFDDFGTGFASLTHLRTFPIDCVKIDRSFVQEIETDTKSRTIITAVGQMAHELGFLVIAEGIETVECADILKDLHCDMGQGFLYGKPTDLEGVEKLLERNHDMAA